jgi:hypothetical protein
MEKEQIIKQLLNGNHLEENELKQARDIIRQLDNEYLRRIGLNEGDFERVNNDTNRNPRYVCHFCSIDLVFPANIDLSSKYDYVVRFCNKLGGKRYHNKSYGGGIVWQSYNLDSTIKHIKEAVVQHNNVMA